MADDTRTRMVEAAVTALQHRGVAGMSFTDVLAASGAARGAIYHHFPGGKAQLVAEAAQRNGADIRTHLAALPATTPHEVVESFFAAVRPVLRASAAGAGCAVAAVTVGAAAGSDTGDRELCHLAAAAFSSWIQALDDRLTAAGLPPEEAGDLAVTLITLLEGAHVLCRAAGTLEPFERTARTAVNLVRRPAHTPGSNASPSR